MDVKIITGEGCKNCQFKIEETGQNGQMQMFCGFNPPMPAPVFHYQVIVQRDAETDQPRTFHVPQLAGWISGFPSVPPDLKCGRYQKKRVLTEMN